MTYGLSDAGGPHRKAHAPQDDQPAGLVWKSVDDESRLHLIEEAMRMPRPMIGGLPVAL